MCQLTPKVSINVPAEQTYSEWLDMFSPYILDIELPECTPQYTSGRLIIIPNFGKKKRGLANKYLMRYFYDKSWKACISEALKKGGNPDDWFCWKSDGEGPLVSFFEWLILNSDATMEEKRVVVSP